MLHEPGCKVWWRPCEGECLLLGPRLAGDFMCLSEVVMSIMHGDGAYVCFVHGFG